MRIISGVGVIHDLLRTYADLNTWTEQDIKVDGDIEGISNLLQRCRNAILHVPKGKELLDDRIADLVGGVSAITIRRIHRGFGRLFHEEMVRRTAENDAAPALADPAPEG